MDFLPLTVPHDREAALAAALDFAPLAGGDYTSRRSYVLPGHPHVSRLAPAIRTRLITERETIGIALDAHGGQLVRCEKFVQEVVWRGYWRSWLEMRPAIWSRYLQTRADAPGSMARVQTNRAAAIEAGESGVTVMDNFARELVETGYLHNHARMWFASYWIHVERLPWELGSDFFERHLTCACPAANTLSWRWVAGIQTRGKTSMVRSSNIEKYCGAEYIGGGAGFDQIDRASEAHVADGPIPAPQYPEFDRDVVLDGASGRAGLWITEDDCTPETSILRDAEFGAVCTSVVGAPEHSATSNGLRRAYRLRATADAAARATAHWKAPAVSLIAESDTLAAAMTAWATVHDVKTVVALKPFVGPTGDALPALRAALGARGIGLHLLRRAEDIRLLNDATAGFFKFWEAAKKGGFAARP